MNHEHLNQSDGQERKERFHQMATFVVRYAKEIKLTLPISSDLMNFISAIESAETEPTDRDDAIAGAAELIPLTEENEERFREILEKFETKAYIYSKTPKDYDADAKRILLNASEPLAFNTTVPLLRRLKEDRRCREILFLTDNVSGKKFSEDGAMGFADVRDQHSNLNSWTVGILDDLLTVAEKDGGFDIAIVSFDIKNSPQSLLAHAARGSFGAKRLYYVTGGWSGIGSNPLLSQSRTLEQIDGIFCNDHLASLAIQQDLPDFSKDKIFETGTPSLDGLELDKVDEYDRDGRAKLGIPDNALAILYSGGIQKVFADGAGSRRDIERQTFVDTVDTIASVARAHLRQQYAILVRRHPREDQKESGQIYDISKLNIPDNIKIIPAHNDTWKNGNEVASMADICVSLQGTDSFNAHFRGTEGVLLGYKGEGMGEELQEKTYGSLMENIRQGGVIRVVDSPQEFAKWLGGLTRAEIRKTSGVAKLTDPTGSMLDAIFKK